jgi:hypothetical protein
MDQNQDFRLVEGSYSRFKWNLISGSNDSSSLLESIYECPKKEIYRQALVQTILNSKWSEQFQSTL